MDAREYLKKCILEHALVDPARQPTGALMPNGRTPGLYVDFRTVLFEKEFLAAVATLFWETFSGEERLQIGGLETTALPLITACVMADARASGFYIRKSRKKRVTMRQVEGTLTDAPIALIDDVLSSGASFERQIAVLEKEGKSVSAIFVLVRMQDMSAYTALTQKGIAVHAVFSFPDLGIHIPPPSTLMPLSFSQKWYFAPPRPHFFEEGPKSQIAILGEHFFLASDSGTVWCLERHTGAVVWSQRVVWKVRARQRTFTDIALEGDTLYVGAMNGVLYTLDVHTGRVHRASPLAERLTTRPIVAGDLIICGGADERARSQGMVVALSRETRTVAWRYDLPHGLRAQPLLMGGVLYVGDREGTLHALSARDGRCLWTLALSGGISSLSSFHPDTLEVTTDTGHFCEVDVQKQNITTDIVVAEWLCAPPCVTGRYAFFSSPDKSIYCIDREEKKVLWEYETRGRVFSEPVVHKGRVYVGSNEGRLHVLDVRTGWLLGSFVVAERITNPVVIDGDTIMLTTFAQEVYCLTEQDASR